MSAFWYSISLSSYKIPTEIRNYECIYYPTQAHQVDMLVFPGAEFCMDFNLEPIQIKIVLLFGPFFFPDIDIRRRR